VLAAIDTSTHQISLACYEGGALLAECSWDSAREHTAQLMPQLNMLIQHVGRERASISSVAVALGPGSWSGLRVGLSTAKGLALARGIPIVGISTLDALVYQFAGQGLPVVPLIRLGRERYATYDTQLRMPRSLSLETLASEIGGRALFCGDVDGEVAATLAGLLGDRAHFPAGAASIRRAGYLAELAWRRAEAGDTDDVATLEPIYLGQPVRAPH
jgi:tRNA threonylcarbamoyladenosine biosynthesis protein TsaB